MNDDPKLKGVFHQFSRIVINKFFFLLGNPFFGLLWCAAIIILYLYLKCFSKFEKKKSIFFQYNFESNFESFTFLKENSKL